MCVLQIQKNSMDYNNLMYFRSSSHQFNRENKLHYHKNNQDKKQQQTNKMYLTVSRL